MQASVWNIMYLAKYERYDPTPKNIVDQKLNVSISSKICRNNLMKLAGAESG